MTPRILICTPTNAGIAKIHFVVTLADTMRVLMEKGIGCSFLNYDSSDVAMARNFFAARLLAAPQFSHLLFIDSDMSFEGGLILRFLDQAKPIIGAVYTRREIDLEAYRNAIRQAQSEGEDTKSIEDLSGIMEYVVRLEGAGGTRRSLTVANGFAAVGGIGMGATLIERGVFETMITRGAVRRKRGKYADDVTGHVYGFFDPIYINERDEFLSEDLSFCQRWIGDCQGQILACVDSPIGHVGQFVYRGVYLEKLRRDKKKGR